MWAVRQSPYPVPDNLQLVITAFQLNASHLFNQSGMAKLSREDVKNILEKHLFNIPECRRWNERKNGNQRPFGIVTAFGRPEPDDDFIDLDALRMNVVNSLWLEPYP